MDSRSRKRQQKNRIKEIANLISAAALLVIAILLLAIVIIYIRGNLDGLPFFNLTESKAAAGSMAGETREEDEEAGLASSSEDMQDAGYGLIKLKDGTICYALTGDEASAYDEEQVLEVSEGVYYLAGAWLDLNGSLYYFDDEGAACTSSYSEGPFKYTFDENAVLTRISYNSSYSAESADGYPGLIQSKALWVFLDESRTIGSYTALKYKKTTESLSSYLGGDLSTQYASPYAYQIIDGTVFYLAVPDQAASSSSEELDKITGKLFCMAPGAEYRRIAAENVYGFKALSADDGTVVYYYDGEDVFRVDSFVKDEDMLIFSENATYTVDISESGKAYLALSSGQRVTMETTGFKSGNFVYSLSSSGEILSVDEKTSVAMGGCTYTIENGTAFGETMLRVLRTDSSGTSEVISAEISGSTANIHYDYDTGCIIAEYQDNSGKSGLLKITLSGDIDILLDSASYTGQVVLYAIQDGSAVYKTTVDDDVIFRTADISSSSPLAAGIDPVTVNTAPSEEAQEVESVEAADYDTTNTGTVETVETPETSPYVTYIAPSSINSGIGPGGSSSAISSGPGGG